MSELGELTDQERIERLEAIVKRLAHELVWQQAFGGATDTENAWRKRHNEQRLLEWEPTSTPPVETYNIR